MRLVAEESAHADKDIAIMKQMNKRNAQARIQRVRQAFELQHDNTANFPNALSLMVCPIVYLADQALLPQIEALRHVFGEIDRDRSNKAAQCILQLGRGGMGIFSGCLEVSASTRFMAVRMSRLHDVDM